MNFIIKFIYGIFCSFYSKIIFLIEAVFLSQVQEKNLFLEKEGYLKIDRKSLLKISKFNLNPILDGDFSSFFMNKYHKRLILNKKKLKSFILNTFNKELCNFLTAKTGFKYSIDFFSAYENFYIPDEDRDKSWYANHLHLDKPNSKNTLKIFIPFSDIKKNEGPLELLSIKKSRNFFKSKNILSKSEINYLIGDLGDMFLCKLNLCFHKAGIPHKNKSTKLIMIQLNPSKKWYINSRLFKRQLAKEPKFTSLTNIFVSREILFNKNNVY